MAKNEIASQDNHQQLEEIFVGLTGKTCTTDRQSRGQQKKIIDVTGANLSPQQDRPDTDFESNGLEDTIDDSRFE